MELIIQPLVALADEKVGICLSGLSPLSQVKLRASYSLPWAESAVLNSSAWFTADPNGRVDLSRQKPESGSYDFVEPMGLIVSASSKDPRAMDQIGRNISVDKSLRINFTAEHNGERASAVLERLFMSPGVKRQKTSEPLVGELFYPEQPSQKTVLVLCGSGSYLGALLPIASLLASHGLNALALSYFRDKGLPAELAEIPLEYFEKAFAWLADNLITKGTELYLLSQSKGAELSLLLASRYPIIQRVAALAPHAYCFQGINFKDVSSWTYQGKPLPYIRMKNRILFRYLLRCFIQNEPFGFTYFYRKALETATNKEAARIPVEGSQADLLLFTNKQNGMWNSYDGCLEIMEVLRNCNYPHQYELVTYEDAGEPYPVPYVVPPVLSSTKVAPRLVLSMGGTLQGNAHAQADSWEKAIQFLKR